MCNTQCAVLRACVAVVGSFFALDAPAAPPINAELSPGVITRPSAFDEATLGTRLALSLHNGRLTAAWPDNSAALSGNPDAPNLDVAVLSVSATPGAVDGGIPFNLSALPASQTNPSIARDPLDPQHLVIVSRGGRSGTPTSLDSLPGVVLATSRDGGATWSTRQVLQGLHAPEVGFDAQGNLFLLAIDGRSFVAPKAVLHVSVDGGETFGVVPGFVSPRVALRPHLAVGPASVWVIVHDFDANLLTVSRATVTGPGQVGGFVRETLDGTAGATHSDISLGPDGNALVVSENRTAHIGSIEARRDPDGTGPAPFEPPVVVTNFTASNEIALPRVVFDPGSEAARGRAYLIHQEEPRFSSNKEIHLRFSDDGGASWSAAIRLNDNVEPSQRIVPAIAVDAINGNVAAIWLDFRDRLATQARVFATALAAPGKPAEPNSPLNLQARGISTAAIELTWTDRSDNESGFALERQGPNPFAGFLPLATVGPDVTKFVDAGHPPQRGFTYRLRAINAAGTSAYTNEAGAATLAIPPGAPSNLSARDASTAQALIQLAWHDNSSNEQGFQVERSTDGVNFAALATVSPDNPILADSGVARGTRFFYRVRSFNSGGTSGFSNVASVLLDGPTALIATAFSSSRIDLRWVDHSARESSFRIERSRDGNFWTEIANVGPNATTFSDRNLRRNTLFFYRVRAQHAEGFSGFTNFSFASTFP